MSTISNYKDVPMQFYLAGIVLGVGYVRFFSELSALPLVGLGFLIFAAGVFDISRANDFELPTPRLIAKHLQHCIIAASATAVPGLMFFSGELDIMTFFEIGTVLSALAYTLALNGYPVQGRAFLVGLLTAAITSWLLIELIQDERIALNFPWITWTLLTFAGLVHLGFPESTSKMLPTMGGGLVIGSVIALFSLEWYMPWPYTGSGTILLLTMAIGIALLVANQNNSNFNESINKYAPLAVLLIFVITSWENIIDPIVRRHHELYTYGLFNALAQNGANNFLQTCDYIPNHPLSQGAGHGEPGGCWLYSTGGFNFPVLILIPFHMVGLGNILTFRIIALLLGVIALIPLHKIISSRLGKRSALIAICLVISTPIMFFWGQMLTFHQFSWIWIGFAALYWLPVLSGEVSTDEYSNKKWIKLQGLAAAGPLIGLPSGSAICAMMALLIALNKKIQTKTRFINAGLLMIWPIIGYAVFTMWFGLWFPNLLESGFLDDKFENRTQWDLYLTDISYYVRESDWHTRLMGPVLLGLGLAGIQLVINQWSDEKTRALGMAGLLYISPSVLQWIMFAQSAYIHDYWVNTYIFGFAIFATLSIRKVNSLYLQVFIVFLLISTASLGFNDLERRQRDTQTFEWQEYLLENVEADDVVITDNTLWGNHALKYMLPTDSIHINSDDNTDTFIEAFNYERPDLIIHSSASWDGWNSTDFLNDEGYCYENITTRWNTPPHTAWTPCQS